MAEASKRSRLGQALASSCFLIRQAPHSAFVFPHDFKSRQTFPREIPPPKIHPAMKARSVMKSRNFRITKRRHLLLASNPLYDWIANQISLNTSKRNYKINQVGRNQKVLDPSPESWARTPQQPPSASVEKLWKIMKNDEIFEFPPKLKVDPCPPCSSRSSTNCQ